MKVSFVVIAYNAEDTLELLLDNLKSQNYNHKLIEVILVDSNSTDKTMNIMNDFKKNYNIFENIFVLKNPNKILASGWNVALNVATGDIVLRLDAHTQIPNDFITNNVKCMKSGENICGGKVTSIVNNENKWTKMLIEAENSAFGGGIAKFRRGNKCEYVDTLAFAAYKRDVFKAVGGYDERLVRTEDNEIHLRMKQKGYKFYFSPDIKSERFSRNSLKKLLKQKYLNGYWIGLTLGISPKCFSKYHFIPLVFIISLIISIIINLIGCRFFLYAILISYISILLGVSLLSSLNQKRNIYNFCLPFILFLIHFVYGLGTLIGICKMPFWINKKVIKKYKRIKGSEILCK